MALMPRMAVSPCPNCPLSFQPQHLTVASSCGEKQSGITDRFTVGRSGESFTQRLQALIFNVVLD